MFSVVVLALEGVVAFDLSVPAQVFGHPAEAERYHLKVCGRRPGRVTSSSGFDLHVHHGLKTLETADLVVVPGYAPPQPPPPEVLAALSAAADRGARLMSVCTGAFALAATGRLDGCRATTHWADAAELAKQYPGIRVDANALYVTDEDVYTSAGIAAGIDLCIHVVRSHYGEDIASAAARRMVMAPHRVGGQAQFIPRPAPPNGQGLADTCNWALEHLAEPLTVATLARHARWSPRTFARRFVAETGTTPRRWLTSHRLQRAKLLLETTDHEVEQIACDSGLGTAANLRLLLARDTTLTPTAYRRTYRATEPTTTGRGD